MPLYEYRCPSCGQTTEEFREVDWRDFGPQCFAWGPCVAEPGGFDMQRVITPPAIRGSTVSRP